ncbi:MAG TPA: glycosyltransferase [Candidatus Acidoferrum sp.]
MSDVVTQCVASVTVAYNAAKVLPRQLEALLMQTRPLQEIIVVDNASTDGTAAMLAERYPQVTVLRMPENSGQAGGWAAGLSYAALSKRHDWIWTFDNDSVPEADTLEVLLSGVDTLGTEVGIAAPLPIHRETATCYTPYLWRDGFVKPSEELLSQPTWFADLVIASGCLIRGEVVEKIGLPRADFFIDFVDVEYCLRARSYGYKIVVISRAKLGHEIGNGRKIDLLGYKRLWTNQPPFREYYISRNLTYFAWWLQPSSATKRFVARYLVVHAAQVLLFSTNKLRCLIRIVQGFRDGLRGRLGIRLRPGADASRRQGGALHAAEHTEAEKA